MKILNTLVAVLLLITMPIQQTRAEGVNIGAAIDELSFALTVQWDQKDASFKKEATDRFNERVAQFQKEGGTQKQLLDAMKAKMPDAQISRDLESLAEIAVSKKLPGALIQELTLAYVNKTQTRGASYSSEFLQVAIPVGIMVIVVGLVIAGFVWDQNACSKAPTPPPSANCQGKIIDGFCGC